jgi:spore coat protein JB
MLETRYQIAYPYVPPQRFEERYPDDEAIIRGTMFPELDLPFEGGLKGGYVINRKLPETAETELQKLHFICLELRLYLDTHPDDTNALECYRTYQRKIENAKARLMGPQENFFYNAWVYDPWPWEREGL